MKALFFLFHGFEASNGITKKIFYQVKALQECEVDAHICYYEVSRKGNRLLKVNETILKDFGNTFWSKIKKRVEYQPVIEYILSEGIQLVYIRSFHNANPFTISLIKQLKKHSIKVVMEVPTYPYDQEYVTLLMKCQLFIDKLFRKKLAQQLNAITTFSNENIIFGQRTIRISNGIDLSSIPLKTKINGSSYALHLIGVAEIHYWHGFDRVVKGLAKYYQKQPEYNVFFHIVGEFSGPREEEELLTPIKQYNLSSYVILHGPKHGQALDVLFNKTDMGIGSLGRHRSNITHIKTLKNREYAARGIPFIYSETDSDFDNKPYVMKAPPDESPIDIDSMIRFYQHQKWKALQIRESVRELSWKNQMQKVLDQI